MAEIAALAALIQDLWRSESPERFVVDVNTALLSALAKRRADELGLLDVYKRVLSHREKRKTKA